MRLRAGRPRSKWRSAGVSEPRYAAPAAIEAAAKRPEGRARRGAI
ncbi:hypothetical protein amb3036 [Paramagnetospirillum magneticum AMB-1]|uniref:Uncharacterized protein n=1 Tax=Paramagnetospirillum magneticum (strain ATCC 700264 / AMB-1) TaxID=342108 RepID=Q2W2T5_PARM1|nr:hypothetical protein amb3036 [Paramagnetospirillum magneticum AMB-1]